MERLLKVILSFFEMILNFQKLFQRYLIVFIINTFYSTENLM